MELCFKVSASLGENSFSEKKSFQKGSVLCVHDYSFFQMPCLPMLHFLAALLEVAWIYLEISILSPVRGDVSRQLIGSKEHV